MNGFVCPHCNQVLDTEEPQRGTDDTCPHCGELLGGFRNKEVLLSDCSPQTGQGGAELPLEEENVRKTPSESKSFILRQPLKKIIYETLTNPLDSFYTILFVLLFLLAIMTLFFIYAVSLHVMGIVLLFILGLEITVYLCKAGILAAFIGIVIAHPTYFIVRKAMFAPKGKRFLAYVAAASYVALISLYGIMVTAESFVASRQAARRISCQNNLRQIGHVFLMYCQEYDSLPPLLSSERRLIQSYKAADAKWIPDIYNTLQIHFCPHDKKGNTLLKTWLEAQKQGKATLPVLQEVINKSSYMYLGYAVTNDAEMRAFADAYKERIAQGLPFDADLEVPSGKGTDGGNTILRLKKIATAASSEEEKEHFSRIPVLWDRCLLAPDEHKPTFFHSPKGIHVLFLDGHCEFIRYGEDRWPLTEKTLRIFWELENL